MNERAVVPFLLHANAEESSAAFDCSSSSCCEADYEAAYYEAGEPISLISMRAVKLDCCCHIPEECNARK